MKLLTSKIFLTKYWYILLITSLILISFFLFSTSYKPLVCSDDALNVLIASTYKLPDDFYCWGQDRGGTLIPFFSQLFIFFKIHPTLSVSLSNYIILTLGFLGFSQLFRSNYTKLIFAILWFLPYHCFVPINIYPIGMGCSLFGFSLIFLRKLNFEKFLGLKNLIIFPFILIIWFLAIWASDIVVFTILNLSFVALIFALRNKLKIELFKFFSVFFLILFFIIKIILSFKQNAPSKSNGYLNLNSPQEVLESILMVSGKIKEYLLFRQDFISSLGAWILVLIVVFILILTYRNFRKILNFNNFFLSFFFLNLIINLTLIFSSNWVLKNDVGHWYFIASYIDFIILTLIYLEKINYLNFKQYKITFVIASLFLSLSAISNHIFLFGDFKTFVQKIKPLNSLGQIGLMGTYSETYRLSVINPNMIKCVTHEFGDIKDSSRIDEFFNSKRKFLIKNYWLDKFPDSILQYKVMLYKKGKPINSGVSSMCEYQEKKNIQVFKIKDLMVPKKYLDTLNNFLKISKLNTELNHTHIAYGPFCALTHGKYKINFYIDFKDTELEKLNKQIIIDVTSDYSKKILQSKVLIKQDFNTKKNCFSMFFKASEYLENTEFRVYYDGGLDFNLKSIELIPIEN